MRAVILAAGRGSRLREPDPAVALDEGQLPAVERGLKTLVPVAGRPLLDRLLERLAAAGVGSVCLVVSPRHRELDRYRAARAAEPPTLTLAVQPAPRGTADALLAAREFAGDGPFLMLNSDNLYPADDLRRLTALRGPGLVAYESAALVRDPLSNVGSDRLAAFATVELDAGGCLRGMVEKPPAGAAGPAGGLVSLNCWRFSPRIFDACAAIPTSRRGELELPDAVLYAVERLGERFRAVRSAGPVLDLSRRADVPVVTACLEAMGWPGGTGADPLGRWLAAPRAGQRGRIGRLAQTLRGVGVDPARPVFAEWVPGRIEVAGKHTDYAGGRSLTCATEQGLALLVAPRDDSRVRIFDAGRGERSELEVSPDLEPPRGHWALYPATVVRRLARDLRRPLTGFDVVFDSDLPPAAGLSSSSALVVAFFRALDAANGLAGDAGLRRALPGPEELAAYLGAVERGSPFAPLGGGGDGGVGVEGGDEDHTALLCARPGALVRFRFLPSRLEEVTPLPAAHRFAVAFCGVHAEKAGAARDDYNRAARRAAALAELWRRETGGGEPHLGAIVERGEAAVTRLRGLVRRSGPPDPGAAGLLPRLEHFVQESEQVVPAAAAALTAGDLDTFGAVLDRSQTLATRLLGNQLPETVFLARAARELGAPAASAFGAGFGGSVWSLVADDEAAACLDAWAGAHRRRFPQAAAAARFFLTRAAAAARSLRPAPKGETG